MKATNINKYLATASRHASTQADNNIQCCNCQPLRHGNHHQPKTSQPKRRDLSVHTSVPSLQWWTRRCSSSQRPQSQNHCLYQDTLGISPSQWRNMFQIVMNKRNMLPSASDKAHSWQSKKIDSCIKRIAKDLPSTLSMLCSMDTLAIKQHNSARRTCLGSSMKWERTTRVNLFQNKLKMVSQSLNLK